MARPTLKAKKFVGFPGQTADVTISLTSGWNTAYSSATYAPLADEVVIVSYGVGWEADTPAALGVTTAGYTEIVDITAPADTYNNRLSVSHKKMGGTPDTSVTVTGTGHVRNAGAVVVEVWAGVDTTTAIDVTSTTATGQNTGQPNPPSITPSTTDAVVIVVGSAAHAAIGVFTQPGSELSAFLSGAQADTTDCVIATGYFNWTSGAFDPVAWTGGGTSVQSTWTAASLALRPAVTIVTIPTGIATETDTPLALTQRLIDVVETGLETDTAQALGGLLIRAVGLATETETAFALSSSAPTIIPTGLATEADSGFALTQVLIHRIGVNELTNGHFDVNFTGWTASNSSRSIVNGRLRNTTTTDGLAAMSYQGKALVTGGQYVLSGYMSEGNGFAAYIRVGTAIGGSQLGEISDTVGGTTGTLSFVAPSGTTYVNLLGNAYFPHGSKYTDHDDVVLLQLCAEVNTSLALGRAVLLGRSDEVDSAQTLAQVLIRATGLATTTNTALTLGGKLIRVLGLTSETDTALAQTAVTVRAAGLATETDTSLTRGSAIAASLSSSTETAFALSGQLIRATGLATSTNTALTQGAALGTNRGNETDAALTLSAKLVRAAGLNLETDTALIRGLSHTVNRAAEADTAINRGLALGFSFAAETDTALELSSAAVSPALETDTAFPLGIAMLVGRETEIDEAWQLNPIVIVPLNLATESSTAFPLGAVLGVGPALETDTSVSLTARHLIPAATSTETSAGFALLARLLEDVGTANETDAAIQRGFSYPTLIGLEVDNSFSLAALFVVATGRADEIDTAIERFGALNALAGFKPDTDLLWLRDIKPKVSRDAQPRPARAENHKPAVSQDPTDIVTKRLDDPTPTVHDSSRY